MTSSQKNPYLSDEIISTDQTSAYLFTELNDGEYHFVVDETHSLDLTLIDLSSSKFNLKLLIDLKRDAHLSLSIASFQYLNLNKTFDIYVRHLGDASSSFVRFAGINSSDNKLTFIGTSLIPNGIKKVETRQEGRINNLSSSAKSEVSPVLLINDNDVKASHGAALGAYNPDALFYLTSRGISIEESQKLIIKGTLSPIINKLHDESLIKEVNDFFQDRKL